MGLELRFIWLKCQSAAQVLERVAEQRLLGRIASEPLVMASAHVKWALRRVSERGQRRGVRDARELHGKQQRDVAFV